jgi:hypothetical protein
VDHSYDSARVQELLNTFHRNPNVPPEKEDGRPSAAEPSMIFPKEFNRSFWRSVDRRFLIVLLFVLIFEPVLIFYLLTHTSRLTSDQYVAKLQSKYVDLFLQDFVVETPAPDKPKNELLIYAKQYAENLAGEAFGTAPFSAPGEGSPETRTGAREARARGDLRRQRVASRAMHCPRAWVASACWELLPAAVPWCPQNRSIRF